MLCLVCFLSPFFFTLRLTLLAVPVTALPVISGLGGITFPQVQATPVFSFFLLFFAWVFGRVLLLLPLSPTYLFENLYYVECYHPPANITPPNGSPPNLSVLAGLPFLHDARASCIV